MANKMKTSSKANSKSRRHGKRRRAVGRKKSKVLSRRKHNYKKTPQKRNGLFWGALMVSLLILFAVGIYLFGQFFGQKPGELNQNSLSEEDRVASEILGPQVVAILKESPEEVVQEARILAMEEEANNRKLAQRSSLWDTVKTSVLGDKENGECGDEHFTCKKGRPRAKMNLGNKWKWRCSPRGGGDDAVCEIQKPNSAFNTCFIGKNQCKHGAEAINQGENNSYYTWDCVKDGTVSHCQKEKPGATPNGGHQSQNSPSSSSEEGSITTEVTTVTTDENNMPEDIATSLSSEEGPITEEGSSTITETGTSTVTSNPSEEPSAPSSAVGILCERERNECVEGATPVNIGENAYFYTWDCELNNLNIPIPVLPCTKRKNNSIHLDNTAVDTYIDLKNRCMQEVFQKIPGLSCAELVDFRKALDVEIDSNSQGQLQRINNEISQLNSQIDRLESELRTEQNAEKQRQLREARARRNILQEVSQGVETGEWPQPASVNLGDCPINSRRMSCLGNNQGTYTERNEVDDSDNWDDWDDADDAD